MLYINILFYNIKYNMLSSQGAVSQPIHRLNLNASSYVHYYITMLCGGVI